MFKGLIGLGILKGLKKTNLRWEQENEAFCNNWIESYNELIYCKNEGIDWEKAEMSYIFYIPIKWGFILYWKLQVGINENRLNRIKKIQ